VNSPSREDDLVELVTEAGEAVGTATVAAAHRPPGRLHRAFSVLLLDPAGRLLLQQRAAAKTRFALRWANACCGHPTPGAVVADEAARRLAEEVGVRGASLTEVGVYIYRADDPATGRVEHEYDHVLLGRASLGVVVDPDPSEVAALRWIALPTLRVELATEPNRFAPWLSGVLDLLDG
jgi:isopentenyl-diphosphate Delta-isomerase